MSENEFVPVFDAQTEVQALLYRTMLEEAGIDVVERPMEAEWFEGIRQRGLHSQLLVSQEHAERARQLVEEFHEEAEEGELAIGESDESSREE